MADSDARSPLQQHLHRLLDKRAGSGDGSKTICPSEAARALSASELDNEGVAGWRDLMPRARDLLFALRNAGRVQILQKGEVLGDAVGVGDVRGPIRARWTTRAQSEEGDQGQ